MNPATILDYLKSAADAIRQLLAHHKTATAEKRETMSRFCVDLADSLGALADGLVTESSDVFGICAKLRAAFLSKQATAILKNHPDRDTLLDVLGEALGIRRRAIWELEQSDGPLSEGDPKVIELRELEAFFRQHAAMLAM